VNTSIRPEWFYHPSEDAKVKTLPQLMDLYYNSIGRNGTLLLNFPIDTKGLIHPTDEKAGIEFAKAVKEAFAVNLVEKKKATATNVRGNSSNYGAIKAIDNDANTFWATDDNVKTASLTINFGKPTTFNRFLAQEYIRLGQRVKAFTIEAFVEGKWKEIAKATTIGYKRILRFPSVTATQVRLNITDSKNCPLISNIGLYNAPQILTSPSIIRNQAGEINIIPVDKESLVYYTLDGSVPTPKSNKFTKSFPTDGKIEVKAIAYDSRSSKSSPVSQEKYDISRKNWKVISSTDALTAKLLDGNNSTFWHQPRNTKLPVDLVIDLGQVEYVSGFRYLPDQGMWNPGIITQYEFYVSLDNSTWKLVSEGEFANIKNNPLWQTKNFVTEKVRYIKLRALRNTQNNNETGYAELDIITN
jgi:alpha-L-fucosidase